ncbi:hypothetical protein BC834DRAFT_847898 [Gloeopeniophorella convolvens]|nr:hypothetical protein BC834DRAFT_847898 [Gloeopeniophorella convolvens]
MSGTLPNNFNRLYDINLWQIFFYRNKYTLHDGMYLRSFVSPSLLIDTQTLNWMNQGGHTLSAYADIVSNPDELLRFLHVPWSYGAGGIAESASTPPLISNTVPNWTFSRLQPYSMHGYKRGMGQTLASLPTKHGGSTSADPEATWMIGIVEIYTTQGCMDGIYAYGSIDLVSPRWAVGIRTASRNGSATREAMLSEAELSNSVMYNVFKPQLSLMQRLCRVLQIHTVQLFNSSYHQGFCTNTGSKAFQQVTPEQYKKAHWPIPGQTAPTLVDLESGMIKVSHPNGGVMCPEAWGINQQRELRGFKSEGISEVALNDI